MAGRPVGALALALQDAARAEPGTVRALAARARVGYRMARYTATRMVARGELVALAGTRPAVLAVPGAGALCVEQAVVRIRREPDAELAALAQQIFQRVA